MSTFSVSKLQCASFLFQDGQQIKLTHNAGAISLKTQPVILELSGLSKTWPRKYNDYRNPIVFLRLRFQNIFCPPKKAKSFGIKSVFEKLRFSDGLVWTVGPTVEIKLSFQFPPA